MNAEFSNTQTNGREEFCCEPSCVDSYDAQDNLTLLFVVLIAGQIRPLCHYLLLGIDTAVDLFGYLLDLYV